MATQRRHGAAGDEPIATKATYVAYKQDTRDLVAWMIKTSNFILKTRPTSGTDAPAHLAVNTSGQATVAALLSMAELISNHSAAVSSSIFRLLLSVVRARSAHYAAFTNHVSMFPDAAIEKSNATHEYFITSLIKIFEVLGGNSWLSKQMEINQPADKLTQVDYTKGVREVIFSNQFTVLDLSPAAEESEQESDNESEQPSTARKRAKKKNGKGKKDKKHKSARNGRKTHSEIDADLDSVQLDSYRILEDDEDLMMSYVMAVCAFKAEWTQMRGYIQDMWYDVMHDGLNSAVAGAVSTLAIAKVEETALAIFVDFPGNDSFENMMQSLIRGDLNGLQCWFELREAKQPNMDCPGCEVDIAEQLMLYPYEALVDFVTDHQKNRTGKPTKAMQARLGTWDPNFDVQAATKHERLEWRYCFTINWLYDLVNVFHFSLENAEYMKSRQHLADVPREALNDPLRKVFGLQDFTEVVASWAMENPGTALRKNVLPHHVFQLQCIIDAMSIQHGWSLCDHGGHILGVPAANFSPQRDVEMFLDRDNKIRTSGAIFGFECLGAILKREMDEHNYVALYDHLSKGLLFTEAWLNVCLGRSNSDGLWEYSPFLCGIGLLEGLQAAYSTMMWAWDRMIEPMLVVHLYNMLIQEDYIHGCIPMYTFMRGLFKDCLFVGGRFPQSNYKEAFEARLNPSVLLSSSGRRMVKRPVTEYVEIVSGTCIKSNTMYTKIPQLILYQNAGWRQSRIPDTALHPRSALAAVRLGQTRQVLDPTTGKLKLEDTPLVRHVNSYTSGCDCVGLSTSFLKKMQTIARHLLMPEQNDGRTESSSEARGSRLSKPETVLGELEVAKIDFMNEISGHGPLLGVNYASMTTEIINIFTIIERELDRLKNPLFVRVYTKKMSLLEKRINFVRMALSGKDKACLRVIAEVFQDRKDNPYVGAVNHPIYWERLENPLEDYAGRLGAKLPDGMEGVCSPM